jgi:hypothetical protein
MVRVNVEITPADWVAFQRHAGAAVSSFTGKAATGLSWRSIVLGIPAGVLFFFAVKALSFDFHTPTAVLLLVVILLFWAFFRWQLATAFSPTLGGALVGHREITLDEDGIVEASANHTHQSRWAGVVAVDETSDHVFLMIDRFAGYIVPKRAFQDAINLNAFVTFARARLTRQAEHAT